METEILQHHVVSVTDDHFYGPFLPPRKKLVHKDP